MAQKHAGFKSVRIRSEVSAIEGDKPTGVRFTELTLYNPKEGLLRSSALNETGQILYSVERMLGTFSPAPAVLFGSRSVEIAQVLNKNGIPVRTENELTAMKDEDARRAAELESLNRWNGSIAWVIGKKDASQLWVEKESFLPLRLVLRGGADIHLDRYRFYREYPYPRMITVLDDGKNVLQDEVTEVSINAESPEWKTPPGASGFTDAGNSATSAVRDLIKKYYETIR
jgi:hypothetical protein